MTITLANLADATEEQIFRQVYAHALAQGARATIGGELCRYRTQGGLKCAAGCLIADSEYKPEFEGKSWNELSGKNGFPEDHKSFISWLQKMHDTARSYNQWIEWMESLREHKGWIEYKEAVT
ncbi:MAG: hypothetical protein MN733_36845 [Nitrososphaera sp.]|nr:hypothetical protein [Nitrososphaera sp.]